MILPFDDSLRLLPFLLEDFGGLEGGVINFFLIDTINESDLDFLLRCFFFKGPPELGDNSRGLFVPKVVVPDISRSTDRTELLGFFSLVEGDE